MDDVEPILTAADVTQCYRFFLKRDPESEEVIQRYLAAHTTLWQMIESFANSEEALRWSSNIASGYIHHNQSTLNIDVKIEESENAQLLENVEAVWSQYGREDAYFSVITDPRYRSDAITEAEIQEFYKSGTHDFEFFQWVCRRNAIEFSPYWKVAELGCGVGRVGQYFARACSHYTGIDISRPHLRMAEKKFREEGLSNSSFYSLSDFIRSPISCDLFYSYLVLQHNPPPVMYKLLQECLSRLNAGGIAYFQVPCFLYDYSFDIQKYLGDDETRKTMEMHALPQRYILEIFATYDIVPIEVVPSPVIGPIGFSYTFLGRKRQR